MKRTSHVKLQGPTVNRQDAVVRQAQVVGHVVPADLHNGQVRFEDALFCGTDQNIFT